MTNRNMEYLLGEVEKKNFVSEFLSLESSTSWSILKEQVMKLEGYAKIFKEIVREYNCIKLNIEKAPEDVRKSIISAWKTIFEDLPDEVEKEEDDE